MRPPPRPTLFPYTTLFRSLALEIYTPLEEIFSMNAMDTRYYGSSDHVPFMNRGIPAFFTLPRVAGYREAHHSQTDRSEEHTSELQSRFDLVCRLLLEKKKS